MDVNVWIGINMWIDISIQDRWMYINIDGRIYIDTHIDTHIDIERSICYGVANISRLLKIVGLFCRI